MTDYPPFDLDKVADLFKKWLQHKEEDILRYRDQTYQSVMTGTMAANHHTEWLDEMDDSYARYFSVPGEEEDEIEEAKALDLI